MTVIESPDCTWHFDSDAMLFRSVVKGPGTTETTSWLPYARLIVEGSDSFVIVLDEAGRRRVRILASQIRDSATSTPEVSRAE